MKRRQSGRLMFALLGAVALVAAGSAAWLGSQRATASSGAAAASQAGGSGILRIGTTSYIDSFNPWNYIEGQGLNAMIMAYPLLVQVDYSNKEGYYITGDWAKSWKASTDGKTWTFKLRPNTKWSDGRPMTAADAAWTINTTIKYVDGATAVQAIVGQPCEARDGTELDDARRPLRRAGRRTRSGSSAHCRSCRGTSGSRTRRRRRAARRSRRTGPRTSCRWSPAARTRSSVREEGHDRLHSGPELLRAEVERRRGRADLLHELGLDDRRPAARKPRLDRPGAVRRGERRQEEQGREGQRVARRGDHEHHVEREPAQAQEPRAARPAREEGALDVRRTGTR